MLRVRIAGPARTDITDVLTASRQDFGPGGVARYSILIEAALRALGEDGGRSASQDLSHIKPGYLAYHLRHSRAAAKLRGVTVRSPRHMLIYRLASADEIVVLRLLHDAMDLPHHLTKDAS